MKKKIVTVRHLTLGDDIPKICVPVTARSFEELKEQTAKIRETPFDLVELRADFFEGDPIEELNVLSESLPDAPILFTFRTKAEGGERSISPEAYTALCLEASGGRKNSEGHFTFASEEGAVRRADFIDLEINQGESLVRNLCQDIQSNGTKTVLSFHDFSGTPDLDTLLHLFARMQDLGADVTKVAVMPHTERDVLTLLSAAVSMKESYADRPYIVMSMGRLGGVSRLAGSLLGSAVTFASAGAPSAPGQLDAHLVSQVLAALG